MLETNFVYDTIVVVFRDVSRPWDSAKSCFFISQSRRLLAVAFTRRLDYYLG